MNEKIINILNCMLKIHEMLRAPWKKIFYCIKQPLRATKIDCSPPAPRIFRGAIIIYIIINVLSDGAIWSLLGFLEPLWVPNEEFMGEVRIARNFTKKKIYSLKLLPIVYSGYAVSSCAVLRGRTLAIAVLVYVSQLGFLRRAFRELD